MSESIISTERECFACKTKNNLHRHHILPGVGRRKLSEEYGCWVWLCAHHHNLSPFGVHQDKDFDLGLKRLCQQKLMDQGWTVDQFIATFGKNYL